MGEDTMKKNILAALVSSALLAVLPAAAAAEGSLTLDDSIRIAWENNEQIKAADSSVEAAGWDLKRAKGAGALSVNISHTTAKIGGAYWQTFHIEEDPSSYFINTIAATLPLYTGGRVEHGVRQAEIGRQISALQLKNTKQKIRYEAAQAYYSILACRNTEQAKAEAVSQLEGHLQNVQQQFSVGMVARADILRSEVALADARQGLVTAANNTKLAEASFNKILGRPIPEPVKLAAGMEYVPENYELENCVEYALAHRPDQVAAQKTVQQAGESIEIASAGKKPNLSFDASYTTYDTKVDEFDTKQWIVGLTASLNVFDGNVTSSQINAAKARRAQAEHQEKDGGAAVEFEVRQAYLNMKKAESNIGTNKVAVEKAREDFSLATARYGANLGTNLDVVDAQVSLTNARTAYIESLYDYNVSRAGLETAVGKE